MTKAMKKVSGRKTEADRAVKQPATLADHYRAIGPAAIAAALICRPKKDIPGKVGPKGA